MADEFDYKIATKNQVALVNFKGRISKEAKEKLEACQQELQKSKPEITIFSFRDVPAIDMIALRELTLLQQEARKDGKKIFVVGLNSSQKSYLAEKGVIRIHEVKNSVEEALSVK